MGDRRRELLYSAAVVMAAAALLAMPAHGRPPDIEDDGPVTSLVSPQPDAAALRHDEGAVAPMQWSAPAAEARAPGDVGIDWGALPIGFSAPAALGLAALATVALRARHRRSVAVP